jgi:16S rRNA (uracil1498-N3)-methyltransferase
VTNNQNGFVAHCETGSTAPLLTDAIKNQTEINILIGPEGDFTPKEISFAKANHYSEVTFGKSILRTETAGVYCAAITNALL